MNGISMKEKKSFHISQNALIVPLHRDPIKPVDSNIFSFLYAESMTTSMMHPETMDSNLLEIE